MRRLGLATYLAVVCCVLLAAGEGARAKEQARPGGKAPATRPAAEKGFRTIFDGKTFKGWEGSMEWFRIEDGAIVGGRLDKKVPRNEFLCTKRPYGDFELRLKVKLVKPGGNAGIQIRSERIPNHHEMRGYQADVGGAWWGKLYDESRRRKVLAGPDGKARAKLVRRGEWNDYVIRCDGPRIQLWLNGKKTVDYVEKDAKVLKTELARRGLIGLQIHGGPANEAWYKDIRIKELKAPATKPAKAAAAGPAGKRGQDPFLAVRPRELSAGALPDAGGRLPPTKKGS